MEKLKPSEEEIIKLGEKIVKELQLESSVNTLGKWMSHYVAELMVEAENAKTQLKKNAKKKECCDVILQLWSNREHLPNVTKPLSDLEPLIGLLDSIKKDDGTWPIWSHFRDISDNSTWKAFTGTVKNNSENIFELAFYSAINSDLLKKKKQWIKEHKGVLAKEELEMLKHLENLVNRSKSIVVYSDDKEEELSLMDISVKERYEAILNKVQAEIEDMLSEFKLLKKMLLITEEKG